MISRGLGWNGYGSYVFGCFAVYFVKLSDVSCQIGRGNECERHIFVQDFFVLSTAM